MKLTEFHESLLDDRPSTKHESEDEHETDQHLYSFKEEGLAKIKDEADLGKPVLVRSGVHPNSIEPVYSDDESLSSSVSQVPKNSGRHWGKFFGKPQPDSGFYAVWTS